MQKVRVLQDHESGGQAVFKGETDITVRKGETVLLRADFGSVAGWIRVENVSTGQIGLIPSTKGKILTDTPRDANSTAPSYRVSVGMSFNIKVI